MQGQPVGRRVFGHGDNGQGYLGLLRRIEDLERAAQRNALDVWYAGPTAVGTAVSSCHLLHPKLDGLVGDGFPGGHVTGTKVDGTDGDGFQIAGITSHPGSNTRGSGKGFKAAKGAVSGPAHLSEQPCRAGGLTGDFGQSLGLDTRVEDLKGRSGEASDTLVDRSGGVRSPVLDTKAADIQADDLDQRAKLIEDLNGMSGEASDTLVERFGGVRSPVVDTKAADIQTDDLDQRARLIMAINSMRSITQERELELHQLQEEDLQKYGQGLGSDGCSAGSGGSDEAKLLKYRKAELRLKLAMRVRR